jgi:PTH1 family peptidyl-tRNA hydrolase
MPEAPTPADVRWLAVGLGNPGKRYALSPHNLGFLTLDRVAERNRIRIDREVAAAQVGLGEIGSTRVALAKPQTYMNLSGASVKALLDGYSLSAGNLVLVYDELALPWRAVRIRPRGSSAGHNGVESVIGSLGTGDFIRVRLGIHPGHTVEDGAEFVLAPMRRAAMKELDELLDYGAQAVESIIAEGVEKAMTKYNRRAQGSEKEEE